jgi:hypothetical protein
MATGRRSPTPMPRCARIIRAASASAFRTRNCRRRGRCARRRSTRSFRPARGVRRLLRLRASAVVRADRGGSRRPSRTSFRRSNAHPHVGAECRAVREGVGSAGDLQLRQVRGSRGRAPRRGCRASWRTACRRRAHRAHADAQRARQADRRFHDLPRLGGSFFLLSAPMRRRPITCAGSSGIRRRPGVAVRPCAMEYVGLSIAGPKRARCCRAWCATICRRRRSRSCRSGAWTSAWCRRYVGRVSFTGELGYEIWVTTDYQRALYDLLTRPAASTGSSIFGGRALNSLRVEKSFRYLGARIPADLRAATRRARAASSISTRAISSDARRRSRSRRAAEALLLVTSASMRPTPTRIGDEPIWHDGKAVGWVTSGAYGFRVGARSRSAMCPSAWPRPTQASRSRSSANAQGDAPRPRRLRCRAARDADLRILALVDDEGGFDDDRKPSRQCYNGLTERPTACPPIGISTRVSIGANSSESGIAIGSTCAARARCRAALLSQRRDRRSADAAGPRRCGRVARAFHNTCRHRGAALCREPRASCAAARSSAPTTPGSTTSRRLLRTSSKTHARGLRRRDYPLYKHPRASSGAASSSSR